MVLMAGRPAVALVAGMVAVVSWGLVMFRWMFGPTVAVIMGLVMIHGYPLTGPATGAGAR